MESYILEYSQTFSDQGLRRRCEREGYGLSTFFCAKIFKILLGPPLT